MHALVSINNKQPKKKKEKEKNLIETLVYLLGSFDL